MPTFRLEPVQKDSPNWRRSWHRDVCLIVSDSEAHARERAAAIFDQVARPEQGGEPLVNPWTEPELVRVAISDVTPDHMSAGMIALPDGLGGWQIRGRGGDGTEIAS
jgi:hypothetical protein